MHSFTTRGENRPEIQRPHGRKARYDFSACPALFTEDVCDDARDALFKLKAMFEGIEQILGVADGSEEVDRAMLMVQIGADVAQQYARHFDALGMGLPTHMEREREGLA